MVSSMIRRSIQSHMPFEWQAETYRADDNPRVVEVMRRAAEFGFRLFGSVLMLALQAGSHAVGFFELHLELQLQFGQRLFAGGFLGFGEGFLEVFNA